MTGIPKDVVLFGSPISPFVGKVARALRFERIVDGAVPAAFLRQ